MVSAANAAPRQVISSLLASRPVQIGAKVLLRQLVHGKKRTAQPRVFIRILRALRHGNAIAFGEALERFVKADAFDLHHELQHVAAGLATEAVIKLLALVNVERRALFLMERTQPQIAIAAGLAQRRHVLADYVDDINRRLQLIDEFHCASHYYGAARGANLPRLTLTGDSLT